MRVISGKARGITLKAVPGDGTRPILDRVKTALFDVIRPRIPGWKVLDLFGGAGSVGIEALSQGAEHCIFLDLSAAAVKTIKENLVTTRLVDQAEVRHTDAFGYLRNTVKRFDLIYVAPPQFESLWVQAMHIIAERPEIINADGLVIVQIDPKEYEALDLADFKESAQRKYGNTLLLFYEKKNQKDGERNIGE
jgi:16S rRNA (guanine966-N2)-methyltransferase